MTWFSTSKDGLKENPGGVLAVRSEVEAEIKAAFIAGAAYANEGSVKHISDAEIENGAYEYCKLKGC